MVPVPGELSPSPVRLGETATDPDPAGGSTTAPHALRARTSASAVIDLIRRDPIATHRPCRSSLVSPRTPVATVLPKMGWRSVDAQPGSPDARSSLATGVPEDQSLVRAGHHATRMPEGEAVHRDQIVERAERAVGARC